MKKILITLVLSSMIFSTSPVLAASEQTQTPTKFTYVAEWLNLNLFTWKNQSKITVMNRYSTHRAEEIKKTVDQNNSVLLADLASRYSKLILEANETIQKSKNNPLALVDITKIGVLSQQKTLSEARQSANSEDDQKTIATIQEQAVNTIKQNISDIQSDDEATNFSDQIIAIWRDPKNSIDDEKETRVYAAGTTENGKIDDGVIIDGGEAKISQDTSGNLKIEYAPGTGPSSVTIDNGRKIWKIQMGDGSVVESYTSGGNVVIGQSSKTVSNVVVNTVSGGTSGEANVVVGSGGSGAGTVIVGGKSVVTSGDSGGSAVTENTVNNTTTNEAGSTGSSGGQVVEQTAP